MDQAVVQFVARTCILRGEFLYVFIDRFCMFYYTTYINILMTFYILSEHIIHLFQFCYILR